LKARVRERTGLTVSVGAGSSKLIAKIASDLDKPDGLLVIGAGREDDALRGLPVTRLPGVGPATAARLRGIGVDLIGDLADLPEPAVVAALGRTHGRGLWLLAHGLDDRAVVAERESKSVSVEDTFEHDIADVARLNAIADGMARRVIGRMRGARLSGRTVSVKVRLPDFTTLTRSTTLAAPTDDAKTVSRLARQLLGEVDVSAGLRLLGVGVSGLTDWTQGDLFADDEPAAGEALGADEPSDDEPVAAAPTRPSYPPGRDVEHDELGRGWVQGAGSGWVTVRFESRDTPPGRVRSFRVTDPRLKPAPSLP
jgi:DNA polymerase-4